MQDGSVTIAVNLDVSDADKELYGLKKEVKSAENQLSETPGASGLEQAIDRAKEKAGELEKELRSVHAKDVPYHQYDAQEIMRESEAAQNAKTSVNEMQTALEQAEKAVESLKSQGKWFGDADFDSAYSGLQRIRGDIALYKKELVTPPAEANPFGLDTYEGKIKEVELELQALKNAGKGLGDEDYDRAYQKMALLKSEAKQYAAELAKTPEKAKKEAEALARAAEKAEALVRKEAEAAAEAARLREIGENAVVSDQRVVDLTNELAALKSRLADLKAAGVGPGYQEYDQISVRVRQINAELRRSANNAYGMASGMRNAGAASEETRVGVNGVSNAMDSARKRVEKFGQRIGRLSSRVFVFSVITRALRAVRTWFGNVTKSNDDASQAIAKLKGALLTLAQPIVNVVIPVFIQFVHILTQVINTISRVVSMLFGTTISDSANAAENLYKESDAIESVGGAAEKAQKQLLGFDEINKLEDTSAGGGGGGAAGSGEIAPDFDIGEGGLLGGILKFSIEDIFFNWDDLTAENILAKIITGIGGIVGAIIGFSVGGVPGALIGFVIGSGLGMLVSSIVFNNDGRITKDEIVKGIMLLLGTMAGGVLGFVLGGGSLPGAAIGITIGAALSCGIMSVIFNDDSHLSNKELAESIASLLGIATGGMIGFLFGGVAGAAIGITLAAIATIAIGAVRMDYEKSDLEKEIDSLVEEISESSQATIDIKARVESITGEVDEDTLVNFDAAKNLIDEIFAMDSSDNKTAAEIENIKMKIDALNSFPGFGDLNFQFDEVTNHVNKTRTEVDAFTDSLFEQYKAEALKEQIIEAYKLQAEAAMDLKEKEDLLTEAEEKQADAQENLDEATRNAEQAAAAFSEQTEKNTGNMRDQAAAYSYVSDDIRRYRDEQQRAKNDLDLANEAVNAANDNLTASREVYENASEKLSYLKGSFTDFATTTNNEVDPAIESSRKNMEKHMESLERGEKKLSSVMGDSKKSVVEDAKSIPQEIASGLTGGKKTLTGAMQTMLGGMMSTMTNFANNCRTSISSMIRDVTSTVSSAKISASGSVSYNVPKMAPIPRLAKGAVIPPNREFMAVLGDQRHGTNIEAPISTIQEAVAAVTSTKEQLRLMQEQNELLRRLLEKDSTVNAVISTSDIVSGLNRKNRRDGRTIIPVGV